MDNYKKYFARTIHNYFTDKADEIIVNIEKNYKVISVDTAFALTSRNPIDRRLDFSAYFLALIKTLDERGESYDRIRTMCLDIVLEYVRPKNKLQAFMKRIPPMLIDTWFARLMVKRFNKRVSVENPQGFVANIITEKSETYGLGYGFDITECGICKLFKKHQYEKYASILCEVDEVTSNLAGLKLIRTSTIALGAHKCDFRFKKK